MQEILCANGVNEFLSGQTFTIPLSVEPEINDVIIGGQNEVYRVTERVLKQTDRGLTICYILAQ